MNYQSFSIWDGKSASVKDLEVTECMDTHPNGLQSAITHIKATCPEHALNMFRSYCLNGSAADSTYVDIVYGMAWDRAINDFEQGFDVNPYPVCDLKSNTWQDCKAHLGWNDGYLHAVNLARAKECKSF